MQPLELLTVSDKFHQKWNTPNYKMIQMIICPSKLISCWNKWTWTKRVPWKAVKSIEIIAVTWYSYLQNICLHCVHDGLVNLLHYDHITAGHLTAKSDVYSFGVVLLEMLSGRRAVDKNRPHGEHNLVEWARPYLTHKRKIFRIIDNRLEGQYSLDGAQKVASLAQNCLSMDAKFRPSMDQMVSTLQQLQDTKQTGTPPSAEEKVRTRSVGSGDTKVSLKDFRGDGSLKVTYPRPSASPLYL